MSGSSDAGFTISIPDAGFTISIPDGPRTLGVLSAIRLRLVCQRAREAAAISLLAFLGTSVAKRLTCQRAREAAAISLLAFLGVSVALLSHDRVQT